MALNNSALKKPGRRPILTVLKAVSRVVPGARPWLQRTLIRVAYQIVSSRAKDSNTTFMNYGYTVLDGENPALQLSDEEQQQRYCVYLYNRVVRSVDLKDLDVLEVGSGRGGGSAFLKRQFAARSVTGVDFADNAVKYCNQHFSLDGLRFSQGDAEHLPFEPSSFDVVASVESSHCYPDIDAFLGEAARVLRPNGHLLITDFRMNDEFDQLRGKINRAGFDIIEDESIVKNVIHALDLDSERRAQLVKRQVPGPVRRTFLEFSGVSGSRVYEDFSSGKLDYRSLAMVKH